MSESLRTLGLPSTDLLDQPPAPIPPDRDRVAAAALLLTQKCLEFGVEASVTAVQHGPVVTTYQLALATAVPFWRVAALADDLSLALPADSVRIVPGRSRRTAAVELPSPVRTTVPLRAMIEAGAARRTGASLSVPLGVTPRGAARTLNLRRATPLLLAGAAGAGKTSALRAWVASLLFQRTPETLRLVLIDPSRIELVAFDGAPHLLTPVARSCREALQALAGAVRLTERRTRRHDGLESALTGPSIRAGGRGALLDGRARKTRRPSPEIVVVVDEFDTLMSASPIALDETLCVLAERGVAAGVHLVVASARADRDVISDRLWDRFCTRLSLRQRSKREAMAALDADGAQHLLGCGDMLYVGPGMRHPVRLHGPYVSENEVARLVAHWARYAKTWPALPMPSAPGPSRADARWN